MITQETISLTKLLLNSKGLSARGIAKITKISTATVYMIKNSDGTREGLSKVQNESAKRHRAKAKTEMESILGKIDPPTSAPSIKSLEEKVDRILDILTTLSKPVSEVDKAADTYTTRVETSRRKFW